MIRKILLCVLLCLPFLVGACGSKLFQSVELIKPLESSHFNMIKSSFKIESDNKLNVGELFKSDFKIVYQSDAYFISDYCSQLSMQLSSTNETQKTDTLSPQYVIKIFDLKVDKQFATFKNVTSTGFDRTYGFCVISAHFQVVNSKTREILGEFNCTGSGDMNRPTHSAEVGLFGAINSSAKKATGYLTSGKYDY
jgi:hypothetical protein